MYRCKRDSDWVSNLDWAFIYFDIYASYYVFLLKHGYAEVKIKDINAEIEKLEKKRAEWEEVKVSMDNIFHELKEL